MFNTSETVPGGTGPFKEYSRPHEIFNQDYTFPEEFPRELWDEQEARYQSYWAWWRGDFLEETVGEDPDGNPIYKFPLKINPIRSIARIHNGMLWGETGDNVQSLNKVRVLPKKDRVSGDVPEEDRKLAAFLSSVIGEVWEQSDDVSQKQEAGLVSQVLGGSYFQICHDPWRTDLEIPLTVRYLQADMVLPVWANDKNYELLKVYIVYRIPISVANERFGVDIDIANSPLATMATYVEVWDRQTQNIYVNGKQIKQVTHDTPIGPMVVNYENRPNPFGAVPVVYIPRIREGFFYGNSFIPEVVGMIQELNGRFADTGDIIRDTNRRVWVGKNLSQNPRFRKMDKSGVEFIDIGKTNPAIKAEPDLKPIDPPTFSPQINGFTGLLRSQIDREAAVSEIAYGVDEGSQRSGTTLQIRMWPTINIAKSQRANWSTGIKRISRMALFAMISLGIKPDGFKILPSHLLSRRITVDWYPFLPLDEDQLTNTIAIRKQSGAMSTYRAVELQDVEDVDLEVKRIENDTERENEGNNRVDTQNNSALDRPVTDSNDNNGE